MPFTDTFVFFVTNYTKLENTLFVAKLLHIWGTLVICVKMYINTFSHNIYLIGLFISVCYIIIVFKYN